MVLRVGVVLLSVMPSGYFPASDHIDSGRCYRVATALSSSVRPDFVHPYGPMWTVCSAMINIGRAALPAETKRSGRPNEFGRPDRGGDHRPYPRGYDRSAGYGATAPLSRTTSAEAGAGLTPARTVSSSA